MNVVTKVNRRILKLLTDQKRICSVMITFVSLFVSVDLEAQNSRFERNTDRFEYNYGFEIGSGIYTHFGDLPRYTDYQYPEIRREGYHLGIDKRINPSWSTALQLNYGDIAQNGDVAANIHNFKATIYGATLLGYYHLDNTAQRFLNNRFAPFIGSGVSFRLMQLNADVYDANGNKYHYWADGTIKDLPESYENYLTASDIHRDYKYETNLADSLNNFSPVLISIPIEAGVRLKIIPELYADLSIQYHFGFNDLLDGHVGNSLGDQFTYSAVGLTYVFGTQRKEKKEYEELYGDLDLDAIDDEDYDGDGVVFRLDKCPGTPKGHRVDQWGCSIEPPVVHVPDSVTVEDVVIEIVSRNPLDSVRYVIVDKITGDTVFVGYTDKEGNITYKFPDPEIGDRINYEVTLDKQGYFTKTFEIDERHDGREKYSFNWDGAIEFHKIEQGVDVGKVYDLNTIYYERNKSEIRPSAKLELNKIVEALRANPEISIELGSHTSSRGTDAYNQKLSEDRARIAAEYIISQGISADRITFMGYGETKLLNHCSNGKVCSEEEHAINRRTEFNVVDH